MDCDEKQNHLKKAQCKTKLILEAVKNAAFINQSTYIDWSKFLCCFAYVLRQIAFVHHIALNLHQYHVASLKPPQVRCICVHSLII